MIEYKGVQYPTRMVDVPGWGPREIATTELEKELIPYSVDDGLFDSREAEEIDNQIWFYVEAHEIEYPEEQLIELLLKEVK